MLKNIPACITPELMKVLMEMGHGDEIILADANFPALTIATNSNARFLRLNSVKIPELLDAVLRFFPLDSMVDKPAALMERTPDMVEMPPNWPHYLESVKRRLRLFRRWKILSISRDSVSMTGQRTPSPS